MSRTRCECNTTRSAQIQVLTMTGAGAGVDPAAVVSDDADRRRAAQDRLKQNPRPRKLPRRIQASHNFPMWLAGHDVLTLCPLLCPG